MKTFFCILCLALFAGCQPNKPLPATEDSADSLSIPPPGTDKTTVSPAVPASTYSNERFRNVTVLKTAENQYQIKGQGQIFEASFNWIVEDGHNELKKGFTTTDAGAPEWGNFDFTIDVAKERPNSTLTLVLFESSAKDGSAQYELPIALE